jgi:hypothetical protein
MTDAQKLREAIDWLDESRAALRLFYGVALRPGDGHIDMLADTARLVLSVQVAEGEVEAVADAVNRARYRSPTPGLPERGVHEEDSSSKEYAYRLGKAALLASALYRQREGKS